jgi:hypothetical protein
MRIALGAFGGAILAYFGSQLFLLVTDGSGDATALARGISLREYEDEAAQRIRPKILTLTIVSGLLGGVTAAFLGAATPAAGRRRQSSHASSTPLDRAEFRRVLTSCAWVDFRDKTADYMQGLIVGRLAESDPALAKRVDGFDELEMDMLLVQLQKRKSG